ncbi:hypothetical protein DW903_15105 [Ruminococcus sp. AM42-10AC]|nr:hypothetical protein DW903_15105 [Ruminococcus sp. AM42-10AC]
MDGVSGGKFRKKRVNFSMVSNEILRDNSISLKAKGLYSLIQSYVTLENFTLYKGFLMSRCAEGRKAFDSAWNELKTSGYLVQYRLQDEKKQFYYEYELLDKKPIPQNGTPDLPVVPFLNNGKGSISEKDNIADGVHINNILRNNAQLNNSLSNHIHITEKDVMEQIGYEPQMHDDFIENIVLIMVEVLNLPDNVTLKINQLDLSAETVKERFRKVRYKHLEYIKLVFQDFTGEISSMKNYMITTIYNAPATCDIYFAHRVNRDQYKDSPHHNIA